MNVAIPKGSQKRLEIGLLRTPVPAPSHGSRVESEIT